MILVSLQKVYSVASNGLEPILIEIEIEMSQGKPGLIFVGLANRVVEEAKDRITSSLISCGIHIKAQRTVINLAPASLQKTESYLELPIAIAILKIYQAIKIEDEKCCFFGELGLDGTLKPVSGIFNLILAAQKLGFLSAIVPQENLKEASLVPNINIRASSNLKEIIAIGKSGHLPKIQNYQLNDYVLQNNQSSQFLNQQTSTNDKDHLSNNAQILSTTAEYEISFLDIYGHNFSKKALSATVAGKHHTLLYGSPGNGKTMLAKSCHALMPKMSLQTATECFAIYSLAKEKNDYNLHPPIRSPHHSITNTGLIGGNFPIVPGEIAKSHGGILLLDELPEFSQTNLESLRQPLTDKKITICRAKQTITLPADNITIATANPCPCGFLFDEEKSCICSRQAILSYQKKLSGPLLDRFAIQILVKKQNIKKTHRSNQKELSRIQAQIIDAKEIQKKRYYTTPIDSNSQISQKIFKNYCHISEQAYKLLDEAKTKLFLSTRSQLAVLAVSQTLADLELSDKINHKHIAFALQCRVQN